MTVWPVEFRVLRQKKVAEWTRQGKSASEIAALLGVTERTVVRDRAVMGVTQRWSGLDRLSEGEIRRAGELLDDGCSLAEVARTLGRSPHSIRRYYPGRGWDRAQSNEYLAALRRCKVLRDNKTGVFIK